MGFFKEMTFPRVLIVGCLLASCYLGWAGWNERQRINELEAALDKGGEVEERVRSVQELSVQFTQLAEMQSTEGMGPQSEPQTYIRRIASKDKIELGQIDIRPNKKTLSRGLADQNFRITPKEKSATFDITKVANFLYTLENESNRVRVTDIKIGVPDRIDPHEYPPDIWTLECTITSRQKE